LKSVTDLPIFIVIPSYNEEENLIEIIPKVNQTMSEIATNYKIVVIDDGSTDNTQKAIKNLMLANKSLMYQKIRRNQGKAGALKCGFEFSIMQGAEIVVMMDADGQDEPEELPKLLFTLDEGYDLVTGSRHDRKDRFIKKYTSKIYNFFTRVVTKAPGKDFNSGYKAMRKEVAQEISEMLYGELHRYITVIAHWVGFKIAEVQVVHKPRVHGKSKYGIARFWRGLIDLITIRFLMSYKNRPSHLFGGIGAISVLLGSVIMAYLLQLRLLGESIGGRPLLVLSVLVISVGFQFMLFGLLAELVVYSQKKKSR
jgi:glycosyltransferase involved in cell wall biosynthesis